MGPPREHGGMCSNFALVALRQSPLQWGRRVNTAECNWRDLAVYWLIPLQWGRRVNTAEWGSPGRSSASHPRLQWGRRVNTAECFEVLVDPRVAVLASMGPPREHGGMLRREPDPGLRRRRFNGAAA